MTRTVRTARGSFGRAAGAALGIGALMAATACASRDLGASNPLASQPAANQSGVPVVVNCEPHQRTIVRPVVVNGAALSQIECVAGDRLTGGVAAAQPGVAPLEFVSAAAPAPAPVRQAVRPAPVVYDDLGDARVVETAAPASSARVIPTRQVVYDDIREPVRKTRSVKKSAVIIGSSAGVGAGVGAAVGGKKGALLGAAIGGGGATIWDQVTRRKN